MFGIEVVPIEGMNDNFPMPGCRIERITCESPEILDVAAHGTKPSGRCPDCGRASRAMLSFKLLPWNWRKPAQDIAAAA